METKTRHSKNIIDLLLEHPQKFDFFQAVRLLISYEKSLGKEVSLRFKNVLDLNFPVASIAKIQITEDLSNQEQIECYVSFMGLVGHSGILPKHITEFLLNRLYAKDTVLLNFLDIFFHRLISIFYSVWESSHVDVLEENSGGDCILRSKVVRLLECLTGHTFDRSAHDVMPEWFLRYAGLLANRVRPAESLRLILNDYFELPILIHPFVGQWLPMGVGDETQLADQRSTGQHNQLGQGAVLGRSVWHVQNRFEIQIGPVDYEAFQQLMPGGAMLRQMEKIVKNFVGAETDFIVRVLLRSESVPKCQLATHSPKRLGWNSWLKREAMQSECVSVRLACHPVCYEVQYLQKKEKVL